MVQIVKLTPETLVTAPRRGAAVPNADGTLALFTESTHKIGKGTVAEIRVLNIQTNTSLELTDEDGVHDVQWMPGTRDEIVYLKSGDRGVTQAIVASGHDVKRERYVAAAFSAPVSNLKLKALDDGVAFVVTGLVGHDGSLYNETTAEKTSTAMVFDTPAIRFWNELYRAQRFSLWYNKLVKWDGKWRLAGALFNLISEAYLEAPLGMYGPGEPTGNFDIGQKGIAVVARDTTVRNPQYTYTSVQVYVPLASFSSPPTTKPLQILAPSFKGQGLAQNIRISPDGAVIAYLATDLRDLYNRQIHFAPSESLEVNKILGGQTQNIKTGREPPAGFEFAGSSANLVVHSEKHGRSILDHVNVFDESRSRSFYQGGGISTFYPLRHDRWDELVVSSSTLIASCVWQLVGVPGASMRIMSPSLRNNGQKFGLHEGMIREFWYAGADGILVHAFMVVPSDFDEMKKYPVVVRLHGGPVSSCNDSWIVAHANFAAWAEQGYVVVLPNLSGSVGYGLEFARRVNDSWGGKPFTDLQKLMDHLSKIQFLDMEKAVLAGGSYAAYLISWCFGHDIIKKFCCAIWHDGIFSTPSCQLQSDIIINDGSFGFSPYPWENMARFEAFNPSRPELLEKWKNAPPTIIVHSEKDYRCPMTEGLAAFNTLLAHGVPSRFLTFSDEGHIVEGAENILQWYRVVFDWVRKCVDGEVTRQSVSW
ncbi:hypothetical protein QQS21_010186 [Conoideocrella luteorostrata]|uniref:Dipeptidyl-peptidase V n=1 Tax=Conoideocrella luteorostrata TaxID=1105319 RepID=A0AAJ0CFI2_9HYPO|nr:hypothetical protein QQS21_010186 [Conoideocrella luteorostrata]